MMLKRIPSKRVFAAFLIMFLCFISPFISRVFAEPGQCPCGKPFSLIQTVFETKNQNQKHYCCTGCGLAALNSVKYHVENVQVGDYKTGKLINAKKTFFAEKYFSESPCCESAWIPFEKYADARKFIFKNGGRILDFRGKMVLEEKPLPMKNKPWIYLGSAFVFLAMYFGFVKGSKGTGSRSKKLFAFALVFAATFSLVTALAVVWKPDNFDHRVLMLALDDQGNHTVNGELQEIILKQNGSTGEYDIGFHFFNIIRNELPKDVRIRILNDSEVSYSYCGLDGKKFDHITGTRQRLQFGHSFNIDILLKVNQEEYIGGFVFSDGKTGEVFVTIPVYIIQT